MKAKKLKEGIYWVGAIDWNVRNFHGYLTQRGTTYNAYLIIDEKITLIDTVKPGFENEMLARISTIIDPSKIDYVVSNHVEMDHSGALPVIMEKAPNAKIITCPKGDEGLRLHYKKDWDFKIVKTGDSISIGKRNLQFVLTPMVHWPDNMLTYVPDEKLLFSNDAFGQHLATSVRFDDEYPNDITMLEARKYYANIVLPYPGPVRKALEATANIDIEIIAPSHGIIWRQNVEKIVDEYHNWVSNKVDKKALIIYDTMWKSTEKIAKEIQYIFEDAGYAAPVFNLQFNHMSDIMTEVLTAEFVCIGSPTLNKNILPSVAGFLTYFQGLAPKSRKGIAFGSYGWGDQSIPKISEFLKNSGIEIIDAYKVKYIPDSNDLANIRERLTEKLNK
ncbi:MAG: FprA family A-type flavoprotein [Bacteroidales bacterium]|nr:FprA family A-type flavoprotein [Bacteroidales bacterium]